MFPYSKKQKLFLLSFVVLYVWLLLIFRFRSARDPGSYFFQPDKGYQPRYSLKRIDESLKYLSAFNQSSRSTGELTGEPTDRDKNAKICVGVVTVKRPLQQNIDTTIASILDHLSPEERSAITVHVLFALSSPSDHPDYNYPWVSNLVDRALTYEQFNVPISTISMLERKKDITRKSLIDYSLTLRSCYEKSNAPWIMMLEDDVVAQRAWYRHTMESLHTIETMMGRGQVRDWLYLRLFYTEKFLGWNSEEWPLYTVCSIGAVSLVAFIGLTGRRSIRPLQGILTNSFLLVICFVCVPLAIILFFLAGRVTVLPMRPGIHLMNQHGCCSQALLFPRMSVPPLIDFLEQGSYSNPHPVDSAIELLADESGFDRLAIVPSQMQHIGAASYKENRHKYEVSGPHNVKGAHGVWSMGFEQAYENDGN